MKLVIKLQSLNTKGYRYSHKTKSIQGNPYIKIKFILILFIKKNLQAKNYI